VTLLAIRVYVFACNAPGCDEDTGKIHPLTMTNPARSAWRVAKAEGWTRAGFAQHYCPGHPDHGALRHL
jgi:hypothetical protein